MMPSVITANDPFSKMNPSQGAFPERAEKQNVDAPYFNRQGDSN